MLIALEVTPWSRMVKIEDLTNMFFINMISIIKIKFNSYGITDNITPCLTSRLSSDTRAKWKERYRIGKKYGIRAAFSGVTGTGLVSLAKEAAVDGIKRHGKRYIGGILVNGGLTCMSGGLPLLTNATKVVKYSKACHSACAAA